MRSKKLDKIEYHQDLKISKEENDYGEDEDNPHLIWAMTVIYSLIALIGIIGNILVIVVVKKVPSMVELLNKFSSRFLQDHTNQLLFGIPSFIRLSFSLCGLASRI